MSAPHGWARATLIWAIENGSDGPSSPAGFTETTSSARSGMPAVARPVCQCVLDPACAIDDHRRLDPGLPPGTTIDDHRRPPHVQHKSQSVAGLRWSSQVRGDGRSRSSRIVGVRTPRYDLVGLTGARSTIVLRGPGHCATDHCTAQVVLTIRQGPDIHVPSHRLFLEVEWNC